MFGNFILTEIVIHTSLQPPIGNFFKKNIKFTKFDVLLYIGYVSAIAIITI